MSGKELVAKLNEQIGPSAQAYYKKVQGDFESSLKRADAIDRQIAMLNRYKLSYSSKGSKGQRDADKRLLGSYTRLQSKEGKDVKAWSDRTKKSLLKIAKTNNDYLQKAQNTIGGNKLKEAFAGAINDPGFLLTELRDKFTATGLIPEKDESKPSDFSVIYAYAIARQRVDQSEEMPEETKASIKEAIDAEVATQFKKMRPDVGFDGDSINPNVLVNAYAPILDNSKIAEVMADQTYLDRVAPGTPEKPAGVDYTTEINWLKRSLGMPAAGSAMQAPAAAMQAPAATASVEEKQKYIIPGLKIDGDNVTLDESQPESIQAATMDALKAKGIKVPIPYGKYVQAPAVVSSTLDPSKNTADYDVEIEKLKARRDRILESGARGGRISKGQLSSLTHPVLAVAGFRDALDIDVPAESRYRNLFGGQADAQASDDIAFQAAADQIQVDDSDQADAQASDDIAFQTTPDQIQVDGADDGLASAGSREAANDPGSLVTEAVVNRLKDAANPNNDIDPRDLIDDLTELPPEVRAVFPSDFVSALATISQTGGAKGSDEDPGMRKKAMRKLMVKYGGQLDTIASEDGRRVSNYIATIDPLNYPTTQSNEVVELLNFLNHPGSFAEGDRPEPGMIQSKSLGSAGDSFLNAGLSTLDDGSPFGEIDEVLESVVENAQDSLIIDSAPTAVASIDEDIDEDPDATRKVEESLQYRVSPGLTVGETSGPADLDLIAFVTNGAIQGKPAFMLSEVPEVTGTTTASAPAPSQFEGSRMAAVGIDDVDALPADIRDQLPGEDDSAVAVNTLGDQPDADLGQKPEAPPSREDRFRQGGAESYDSAMASRAAPKASVAPTPKPAPKPAAVAVAGPAPEPKRQKQYGDLTQSELDAWGRKFGSLRDFAIKKGGRDFGKIVEEVQSSVASMGLPEEFANAAALDIYYATDLGKSDPDYGDYLAKQDRAPEAIDSEELQLAGGLKTPEEGNPDSMPEISDERNRENIETMAEGAEEDILASEAVSPTDPDRSGELVITSKFGERNGVPHEGLDLRARKLDGNTNVYSVMDGQIADIQKDPSGRSGRYVFVNHENGLQTRYFHGESIPDGLQVGMPVKAGDMIMVAGESGNSRGPHLHFEIGRMSNNQFVGMDPMAALPDVFGKYVLDDDLILKSSF